MRIIKAITVSLLLLGAFFQAQAQSVNSVLGQLGARGVTHAGGTTNYAFYLVRLNAQGQLATNMLPASATLPKWGRVIFVDAVNGVDALVADSGSPARPVKTLQYAADNLATENVTYLFVLAPGTYAGLTLNPTANSRFATIGFKGLNASLTTVDYIRFSNGGVGNTAVTVYIDDLEVGNGVRQACYAEFFVYLLGHANVQPIEHTATNYATDVYIDPAAEWSASLPLLTTHYLHTANQVGYTPDDTNNWFVIHTEVAGALDELADRPYVLEGTEVGDMLYWNGTNWALIAASSTNQFLIGGPQPRFIPRIIWPGTTNGIAYWDPATTNWRSTDVASTTNQFLIGGNVPSFIPRYIWPGTQQGQLLYWNVATTNWLTVAPGADNEILHGGDVPVFALFSGDELGDILAEDIIYAHPDFDYDDVDEALDGLLYALPEVLTLTASEGPVVEMGVDIIEPVISWTLNKNVLVRTLSPGTQPDVNLGAGQNGSHAMAGVTITSADAAADKYYVLNVLDWYTNSHLLALTFDFQWKHYWGFATSSNASSDEIIALVNSDLNSHLHLTRGKLTPAGTQYIYFCHPTIWGTPTRVLVNGHRITTFIRDTVTVTNAFGAEGEYYRYRSPFAYSYPVLLEVR